MKATIYEQNNGLAETGDYVAGNDGNPYRVVRLLNGGRIDTNGPGVGNSVEAEVELADWQDIDEGYEPACSATIGGASRDDMDITITATNPRPTATGTEGGVDVDFRLDIDGEFELAGEVTLLQNERGNYSSWGELAHWLDGESLRVLREERFDDAFSRITSEIAAECGDAAGRAYPDGVEAVEGERR